MGDRSEAALCTQPAEQPAESLGTHEESAINTQRPFAIALSISLGLFAAALQFALFNHEHVYAIPELLFVAPDADCGEMSPCFDNIQEAVDAARPGDEILIAAGIYQTLNTRMGTTQTAYISKTISIRGGYTLTNWADSDPIAQPTILDAQGQGRVLYITGEISPTIEGLHITGGDATGLGGASWGGDAGGGIIVLTATATISGSQIYSNTARDGGGLALVSSRSTVVRNTFAHNSAIDNVSIHGWGGGLLAHKSTGAWIGSNTFCSNTARWGGGLLPAYTDGITVADNTITSNSAGQGAGVFLLTSRGLLTGNLISDNDGGDVVYLYSNRNTIVDGNTISGNQGMAFGMRDTQATFGNNTVASNQGNGFFVMQSVVTLINNMIVDNVESDRGAVHIYGSTAFLLHNTIARTTGPGVVVEKTAVGNLATAILTNTVLAGNTTGILVTEGNTATLQATLWGADGLANGQDWTGDGTILTGTINIWGNPLFANPDGGDYHVMPDSPVVNAGISTSVAVDLDGETRLGLPDIGADEYVRYVHLPLVTRQ